MTKHFDGLAPLDYLRGVRDGNIVPTIENLRAALRDVLVPTAHQIQKEFDRATSYDRGMISDSEVLGMLERIRSTTLSCACMFPDDCNPKTCPHPSTNTLSSQERETL